MAEDRQIVCEHPQLYYEDKQLEPSFKLLQLVSVKPDVPFLGRDYCAVQQARAVGRIIHIGWDLVNRKHTYTVMFATIEDIRLDLWAEDLLKA